MNGKGNNKFDISKISWLTIAVIFALGGWFIALPLLLIKLFSPDEGKSQRQRAPYLGREEELWQAREAAERKQREEAAKKAKRNLREFFKSPGESKKSYVLQFVLGALCILLSFAFFSAQVNSFSLMLAVSNLAGGAALISSGVLTKRAMSRYGVYKTIIGSNKAVDIKTLAKKTGYRLSRVEKDLQKMLEKGYFEKGAYINRELGYFFANSEADEELNEAREAAARKTREAAKKEAAKQSADVYEKFLLQIRDVNDRIPGEEMSEKIDQIESVTRQIFEIVQKEPEKRGKIDRFMDYFLPTTLKLLESYASLEKAGIEGENIAQSRRSIEVAMDTIVDGFKHQLDELYKTDALDIETELDVLTQMLKREKSNAKSDFKVATQSK